MMILSRIWYVVLSLVVGAAVYVVSLAVGQYDRRAAVAMGENLKSDSQVVSWALQIDSRRRLDNLLLVTVDASTVKALKNANTKDPIPPTAKDDGKKALNAFNDKLPPEFKNDALFLVDRDGRMVSEIGYDSVNAFPGFELGGYPAVFDAIHGHLRDDTWIWGGKIVRVVTRPVEDEVGQPPLGAVVGVRFVDASFAKDIAKRTRTNVAFYSAGAKAAAGSPESGEEFDQSSFDLITPELANLFADEKTKGLYWDVGRTDVTRLGGDKAAAIFTRLPGDAWELKSNGAGFAVVRPRVTVGGPFGFVTGADDKDKASVKLWLVIAVVFGGSLIGFLFSFLEHSRPQKEMLMQAQALSQGKIDALQLPRFSGGLRKIAQDMNTGLDRIVEKAGGQAKRPANLESILGPVPAQPAMSAFSFPLAGGNDSSVQMPQVPSAPGSGPQQPRPPMPGPPQPQQRMGPPPPGQHGMGMLPQPHPQQPPSGPAFGMPTSQMGAQMSPQMSATGPGGPSGPGGLGGTQPGMGGPQSPRVGGPALSNTGNSNLHAGGPAPRPSGQMAAPVTAPIAGGQPLFHPVGPLSGEDREEATMVGEPPAALLAAATGQHNAVKAGDENSEWLTVYDDFIRTKRQCGEAVDGLTFEKFQQTLRKNRDTLIQKHGCKRVKFSVYVKDGRASLKATPVRD